MKKSKQPPATKPAPDEGWEFVETYLAPPPPAKGRIIGLDCHPDTFTAAVFTGTTPHDARQLSCQADMSLEKLLSWAAKNFTREDLFLMEAGSNSFEIHSRLLDMGLRAVVLESCHVGKQAKSYADNDKMAAARIALVYLQGKAPCVWVPDPVSRERRELLHAYLKAVRDHTAAENSLKSYLNQFAIRLGNKDLAMPKAQAQILASRQWSRLQLGLLDDYLGELSNRKERRKRLIRAIAKEAANEPMMLRAMKLLGIGMINAFALVAVIGDIRRFENPRKLAAYIGLNPGQRQSGRNKDIRIGIGKRGRPDVRHLLIQGAHAILRNGRATTLGKWGWKLFARKGQRNVAVAAVARKLVEQVWHMLSGNPPTALEKSPSFRLKLQKLAVALGKTLRAELNLPLSLQDCILHLQQKILLKTSQPAENP